MEHGGLLQLKEGARSPKRAKWLEFSEESTKYEKARQRENSKDLEYLAEY